MLSDAVFVCPLLHRETWITFFPVTSSLPLLDHVYLPGDTFKLPDSPKTATGRERESERERERQGEEKVARSFLLG